jgi:antirestriction protein
MRESRKLENDIEWNYEIFNDIYETVYLRKCAICNEFKVLKREVVDDTDNSYDGRTKYCNKETLIGKESKGIGLICEKCASIEGLYVMTTKLHNEIEELKKIKENAIKEIEKVSNLASNILLKYKTGE